MGQNISQITRESIQTQNGRFTAISITEDIKELAPNAKTSTVGMAIMGCVEKGLVKIVDKERRGKFVVNIYETVEGADWDVWKTYKKTGKYSASKLSDPLPAAKPEKTPAEATDDKENLSSEELGSAIIDFIESLKKKISEFAEENSTLRKRLSRTDDIAEQMVRDAKLERNQHYKVLLKEKDNIIKRLNQRIETLNTSKGLTKSKTFKLGDMTSFK